MLCSGKPVQPDLCHALLKGDHDIGIRVHCRMMRSAGTQSDSLHGVGFTVVSPVCTPTREQLLYSSPQTSCTAGQSARHLVTILQLARITISAISSRWGAAWPPAAVTRCHAAIASQLYIESCRRHRCDRRPIVLWRALLYANAGLSANVYFGSMQVPLPRNMLLCQH